MPHHHHHDSDATQHLSVRQIQDVHNLLALSMTDAERREQCERELEHCKKIPESMRTNVHHLHIWACASKLALYEHSDELINVARAALQCVNDELESHHVRVFLDYCKKQADSCRSQGEISTEVSYHEFALYFVKLLEKDIISDHNRRFEAQIYYSMADAMSRLRDDAITCDRVGSNIRLAIHAIGKISLNGFKPDDYRFLEKCYQFKASHHHERGEHEDAHKCYEKAIECILDVTPEKRTDQDERHLLELRKLAKHEDIEYEGLSAACKHYGLFGAKTSMTEHYFPHRHSPMHAK